MKASTKDQIDLAARELFFKHGIRKISVDAICKAAGVSRKTFYTYFKNKDELLLQITRDLVETAFAGYDRLMKEDTSFSEKLAELIKSKLEMSRSWSLEFVSDFMAIHTGKVYEYYTASMQRSVNLMKELFDEGQRIGEINPSLNFTYINWALQKQLEHFDAPELNNMFSSTEDMVTQVIDVFIYGLMPPKK